MQSARSPATQMSMPAGHCARKSAHHARGGTGLLNTLNPDSGTSGSFAWGATWIHAAGMCQQHTERRKQTRLLAHNLGSSESGLLLCSSSTTQAFLLFPC